MTEEGPILVVEDDPDCMAAITGLLQLMGYRVLKAKNGAEALALLRSGVEPRVILLDLMMPVMNGWQLHEELKKDPAFTAIPVIIFTADKNANGPLRAAGAEFLYKPASLQDLQTKLGRFFP